MGLQRHGREDVPLAALAFVQAAAVVNNVQGGLFGIPDVRHEESAGVKEVRHTTAMMIFWVVSARVLCDSRSGEERLVDWRGVYIPYR